MFVYSGKCRLCECGLETGKVDTIGKELFTGDIVLTFVQDENGCGQIGGLTVIVCKQFESYSNGDHKLIGDMEPFAMGIRDVSWGESDWAIMKLKDWGDVVDGEHWPDYGFMYTEI